MRLQRLSEASPSTHLAVLLATLLPIYYISYQYHLRNPFGIASPVESYRTSAADFIRQWLNVHLGDPYNPSPLRTYCNLTEWHPNLVFSLDDANGGIGNVRGNILDFLFYAIEAGASIMLPSMAARNTEDISNVWGGGEKLPFGTYFDEEHFLATMKEACPQLAIYKPEPKIQMAEAVPGRYNPRSRRMDVDPGNTRPAYLEHLNRWLKNIPDWDPANLTLVNVERTLWEIDTRSLPPGFRNNFGRVLRIKPEIRRLAAVAVQQLSSHYNLLIDPSAPIPKAAFYGAHLRTEGDAAAAGWLNGLNANYTQQTAAYLSQASEHKLRTLYVASGNATQLSEFSVLAHQHSPPLSLTTKLSLLPPADLAALELLSWDQQALVDYEVLMRCSVFGGFVKSSFSYGLAITRGLWVEELGTVGDPYAVRDEEEGVAYLDDYSRVLGRDEWHEIRIPRGMWP